MTGFSRNTTPQMRKSLPAFLIAYRLQQRLHQDHGLTLSALIIIIIIIIIIIMIIYFFKFFKAFIIIIIIMIMKFTQCFATNNK